MKSMWRVMERIVAGNTFYQVYRLLDVCSDNKPSNIETCGGFYESERDAARLAELKNAEEH